MHLQARIPRRGDTRGAREPLRPGKSYLARCSRLRAAALTSHLASGRSCYAQYSRLRAAVSRAAWPPEGATPRIARACATWHWRGISSPFLEEALSRHICVCALLLKRSAMFHVRCSFLRAVVAFEFQSGIMRLLGHKDFCERKCRLLLQWFSEYKMARYALLRVNAIMWRTNRFVS